MDFKKMGIYVGVAVAVAVGSYATGRYASPDKVVYQEKEKVVEKERVVATSDTQKILDALKTMQQQISVQKDVSMTKKVVRRPDGTVEVTVTKDDKSKTDTKTDTKVEVKEQERKTEIVVREVERVVEREVTKIVERNRPSWALTLQPGFDVAGALGRGSPYSLLPRDNYALKHVVVGMSIERRLVGPLSTGIWANTAGAGGLSIRLEF